MTITDLNIESAIFGAAAMLVAVVIIWAVKFFSRKKPIGLPILREKIKIGHEALKQANRVLSEIYEAFNDTDEVMGR